MQILDRSFFKREIPLAAAYVQDLKKLSSIQKTLSHAGDLLEVSNIRSVQEDPENPRVKYILLRYGLEPSG